MERQPGYYFVKIDGKWEIMEWFVNDTTNISFLKEYWNRMGTDEDINESYFDEIGDKIELPV